MIDFGEIVNQINIVIVLIGILIAIFVLLAERN